MFVFDVQWTSFGVLVVILIPAVWCSNPHLTIHQSTKNVSLEKNLTIKCDYHTFRGELLELSVKLNNTDETFLWPVDFDLLDYRYGSNKTLLRLHRIKSPRLRVYKIESDRCTVLVTRYPIFSIEIIMPGEPSIDGVVTCSSKTTLKKLSVSERVKVSNFGNATSQPSPHFPFEKKKTSHTVKNQKTTNQLNNRNISDKKNVNHINQGKKHTVFIIEKVSQKNWKTHWKTHASHIGSSKHLVKSHEKYDRFLLVRIINQPCIWMFVLMVILTLLAAYLFITCSRFKLLNLIEIKYCTKHPLEDVQSGHLLAYGNTARNSDGGIYLNDPKSKEASIAF